MHVSLHLVFRTNELVRLKYADAGVVQHVARAGAQHFDVLDAQNRWKTELRYEPCIIDRIFASFDSRYKAVINFPVSFQVENGTIVQQLQDTKCPFSLCNIFISPVTG